MAKLVLGNDKTVGVPAVVKEVTPVEPYPLLSRVKDDSNNEIGTVCGYHTDANNQKYAVVCLDAQFRSSGGQYLSTSTKISDLVVLNTQQTWENIDTATSNCTKILDFANANGYTSTAVTHCRNQSFVINGTTYYGQLPTIIELIGCVFKYGTAINNADTSASQNPSLVVPSGTTTWSSSQSRDTSGWFVNTNGATSGGGTKNTSMFVMPILEIPFA